MKSSPQFSQTLAARHAHYIEMLKLDGVPLITYACPHCRYGIDTQRNDTDEPWGSIVCCPYCEEAHYKTTTPNGGEARGKFPTGQQDLMGYDQTGIIDGDYQLQAIERWRAQYGNGRINPIADDGLKSYSVMTKGEPMTAKQFIDSTIFHAGFRPTHINTPYGSFPLVQYRRTRGKQPRVVAVYKALGL